ncbi:MAG: hypothetical protein ABIG39_04530, partial [Candidatus Micrarchaeota archaeon]
MSKVLTATAFVLLILCYANATNYAVGDNIDITSIDAYVVDNILNGKVYYKEFVFEREIERWDDDLLEGVYTFDYSAVIATGTFGTISPAAGEIVSIYYLDNLGQYTHISDVPIGGGGDFTLDLSVPGLIDWVALGKDCTYIQIDYPGYEDRLP